jgi:hypothetical protein
LARRDKENLKGVYSCRPVWNFNVHFWSMAFDHYRYLGVILLKGTDSFVFAPLALLLFDFAEFDFQCPVLVNEYLWPLLIT